MNGIFISYRRDDAPGYAGRLYDRLAAHFGAGRVFMDVQGIEPGVDFVDAIERAIASCEILIVIIGKAWLAADAAGRQRLNDPNDFVRLETATALARGIRIVPVLVEGAEMPSADRLPADLLPLVRRQAVELSHKQWDVTSTELIRTLEKILDRDKLSAAGAQATEHPEAKAQAAELKPQPEPQPPVVERRPGWLYWGLASALLLIAVGSLLYVSRPWHREASPAPAPAALLVTPDKLEFAEQKLQAASPASLLTVANRGGAMLRIGSVSLEGPAAADFMLSENQCSRGELAPGASCALKVVFTPQAVGSRVATLIIAHDVANAVATISVEGRGTEPAAPKAAQLEKPSEPPARQTSPPKQKPEVRAGPPKVLGFDSRLVDDKVELCYGVENAASATIAPEPGAVKPVQKECVLVAGGASKTYTLSARSASGDVVTRAITAPAPAAPAAAALPPSFPHVGDSWEYNFRSMWKNVEPRTFVHQVTAVSVREVRENMSFVANGSKTSDSKSFGAETHFVEWRGQGYYLVEFNPFLQAFGTLQLGTTWKSLATPIEDPFFSNWYSQGRVVGWDSVSVPAGSFKALRVELNSTRNASAGSAAQAAPARIWYVIWYSPEIKRTVKYVRTTFTTGGAKVAEDTYELVKYTVQ